jgi:hypothetical protein
VLCQKKQKVEMKMRMVALSKLGREHQGGVRRNKSKNQCLQELLLLAAAARMCRQVVARMGVCSQQLLLLVVAGATYGMESDPQLDDPKQPRELQCDGVHVLGGDEDDDDDGVGKEVAR